MVVNQLLKYGEFGIVLFDNFQVTERTRNRVASKIARGFESHRLRQKIRHRLSVSFLLAEMIGETHVQAAAEEEIYDL